MDKSTSRVLKIMRNAGMGVQPSGPLPAFDEDPYKLFEVLLPNRCASHDLECIDGLDEYRGLLTEYAKATEGQWKVENCQVTGRLGGRVRLGFESNAMPVVLQFKCDDSDWVSAGFLRAINRHTAKHVGGIFLELPEEGWARVVYLPLDVARRIKRLLKRSLTVDGLVEHFRNGGKFDVFRHYEALELFDKRSSLGDTPFTAVMEAKDEGLALWLFDMGVRPICDGRGRMPLTLAKEYGFSRLQSYLEQRVIMHADKWEDADLLYRSRYSGQDDEMLALIGQVRALADGRLFAVSTLCHWMVYLGRAETFEHCKDTLTITKNQTDWLVQYDTNAPFDASYERRCTLDEVIACVEKYASAG